MSPLGDVGAQDIGPFGESGVLFPAIVGRPGEPDPTGVRGIVGHGDRVPARRSAVALEQTADLPLGLPPVDGFFARAIRRCRESSPCSMRSEKRASMAFSFRPARPSHTAKALDPVGSRAALDLDVLADLCPALAFGQLALPLLQLAARRADDIGAVNK